jgi:peptidyl-prolyl isomerase D
MQSGVENVKALFRQGQAQLALNDLDGALWSLTNASQLEPNDVGIKKELAAVKKKIAERDDKEKKAYARMFS